MAKQFASCNWVPSWIKEEQLTGYVLTGALAKKEVIHWRVPGLECPPEPQDGEVVVFMQHLDRGFSPPGSTFFWDVLANFQLHPQVYLQEEPTVELFRDFFHLNRLLNFLTVLTLNLVEYRFRKGKKLTFLMLDITATPRIGIRHGSTAGTLHLLMKILCRVTVLTDSAMNIHCLSNLLP